MTTRVLLSIGIVAVLCCAWLAYARLGRPSGGISPVASVDTNSAVAVADDEYIGSTACTKCHTSQYQSYLKTAHSLALSQVDPSAEPADAQFEHELSGRSYRVYREGGELRHREWLTAGDEIASDYPLKYLIGSGRHTRSYLVGDDGFLMESPITWYASRQAWGLSPGYNHPSHWGFERAADLGCITCHVGRAEAVDGSLSRIVIHEQAIGCERCHGPGARHAERQKSRANQADANDPTIVNPAMLPRTLQEAVCAQCHLRADATVFLPGKVVSDVRPGRPLTDFRIDYQYDKPSDQMTVVGHVEQMRASRCYQASEELTCTTCHDPHALPDPAEKTSYYRAKCLACHEPVACKLPLELRREQTMDDNCAVCHMPQVATDIPHIAFTHHRIGIHSDRPDAVPDDHFAELKPMDDLSRLSDLDRQRCIGLAYLEVAQTQKDARAHRFYRQRAAKILTSIQQRGESDAEVDAALARLSWEVAPRKAAEHALAALNHDSISPGARVNTLFVLADTYFHAHDWQAARTALDQLLLLRRHSEDRRLLGLCQAESGDLASGAASLEQAVRINPFRGEIHAELARVYSAVGQPDLAARHQRLSQLLKDAATHQPEAPAK